MMNPSQWTRTRHIIYLFCYTILIIIGILILLLIDPRTNLIAVGIGCSLLAAGIAGLLAFAFVFLSSKISDQIEKFRTFGLIDVFNLRSSGIRDEYDKRLTTVKREINIMGFGLRTLRQDYVDNFNQWKLRAHVRILILDPEFPKNSDSYASQRDIEENNNIGRIKEDVNEFLSKTRNLWDERFQIRLYRCLPSINMFRVDDEIFWGPYLMKEQSRNTPTFIVGRGGILFQRFMEHFERIWSDEKLSISAEKYSKGK